MKLICEIAIIVVLVLVLIVTGNWTCDVMATKVANKVVPETILVHDTFYISDVDMVNKAAIVGTLILRRDSVWEELKALDAAIKGIKKGDWRVGTKN